MTKLSTILFLVLVSFAVVACSGGQVGEKGLVRFSQIVRFAETEDFKDPVVAESTVLVALQHPDTSSGEKTFPELELEIRPLSGSAGTLFPLGFAQYGVILPSEGSYRLVAKQTGTELDSLQVRTGTVQSLRLASTGELVTSTTKCTRVESAHPDALTLKRNQELALPVVPVDKDGHSMIGLLELRASGPESLQLDAPLVGRGATANELKVRPVGILGAKATIVVSEAKSGKSFSFDIDTRNEDEPIVCN